MSYSKLKQGESVPFSETLSIQLIQQKDLVDIFKMLADENVNQYLFFAPADESVYQSFFGPIVENTEAALKEQQWPDNPTFVIRNHQGQYMGMTAITQVMFLDGNREVGYQLPVHAWGQGIATRACQLMTELAFKALGCHKVCADCYGSNIGSYTTLEKCGYVQEGEHAEYYQTAQGFDSKRLYGLTQQQYLNNGT
ncbi:GNAT family N-acetyltransferase [Vibrio cionasavignyae]|uniref:GNAT family N-acetyltransferase n=1 Tax=Vibrio cionasavignyae TaxID=2910252 RepID=UPI003D0F467F